MNDINGNEIKIGHILSLNGETDFRTTCCGQVLMYEGKLVSFYGQDALGRDCYDDLDTVNNEREIIGHIDTWLFS
jgi:hypothetical protein